jgi:phage terminase small subunit
MGTKILQPKKRGANTDMLTVQQNLFVQALLASQNFNGTEAARAAGYKTPSQAANKLMKQPQINAAIGKAIHERMSNSKITAARVLEELSYIAFSDIRQILEPDGSFRQIGSLDDATARAISEIDIKVDMDEQGNSKTTAKVRFASKLQALELIMKHLGMLQGNLKIEHAGSVDIVAQLLAAAESNNVVDGEVIATLAKG